MENKIVDRFGCCVKCGKNMVIKKVVDNKVMNILAPDYREVEYLLSDKSKMRVAMCETCKLSLTEEQSSTIMESVISGWKEQVAQLNWTEEKKKKHIEEYSKKEILCKSEGLPNDVLERVHSDFIKSKSAKE